MQIVEVDDFGEAELHDNGTLAEEEILHGPLRTSNLFDAGKDGKDKHVATLDVGKLLLNVKLSGDEISDEPSTVAVDAQDPDILTTVTVAGADLEHDVDTA